jgi:hypothetical protein
MRRTLRHALRTTRRLLTLLCLPGAVTIDLVEMVSGKPFEFARRFFWITVACFSAMEWWLFVTLLDWLDRINAYWHPGAGLSYVRGQTLQPTPTAAAVVTVTLRFEIVHLCWSIYALTYWLLFAVTMLCIKMLTLALWKPWLFVTVIGCGAAFSFAAQDPE